MPRVVTFKAGITPLNVITQRDHNTDCSSWLGESRSRAHEHRHQDGDTRRSVFLLASMEGGANQWNVSWTGMPNEHLIIFGHSTSKKKMTHEAAQGSCVRGTHSQQSD